MFKSSDFKEKVGGNGVPKIIQPGTHYCRIVDIYLDAPAYDKEAYFVNIKLEGVDRGDEFEGLDIDKNNPSLGKYRGQVGTIKSAQYPFSTYTYEGKVVQRDNQIYNWINHLAKQMGILKKMNEKGVEGETIEEYVTEVRKYLIDPELWGHFTIAGKEYFNEGYSNPNYRLFLPKVEARKNLFPFSALEDDDRKPLNLIQFNDEAHIILSKERPDAEMTVEEVKSFEPSKGIEAKSDSIADDFPTPGDSPMSDIELPFN
jgi:hypothetical protein